MWDGWTSWGGAFSPFGGNIRKDREPDHDADDEVPESAAEEQRRFLDKFKILRIVRTVYRTVEVYVEFVASPGKEYRFEFDEEDYEYNKETIGNLILQYFAENKA